MRHPPGWHPINRIATVAKINYIFEGEVLDRRIFQIVVAEQELAEGSLAVEAGGLDLSGLRGPQGGGIYGGVSKPPRLYIAHPDPAARFAFPGHFHSTLAEFV